MSRGRDGIASALLAGLALLTAGGDPTPAQDTTGRDAPAFPISVRDPVRKVDVSLRPGDPLTHVVFFATWCPPCLEELGRLAELQATWGRQGYRLVLIAVATRQTEERMTSFQREQNPPGELFLDASGSMQRAWGIEGLPSHVLLDAQGRVLLRAASLAEGVAPAVESALGRGGRRRG